MIKSLFPIIIAIGLASSSIANSFPSLDCGPPAPKKPESTEEDKDKPTEQSNFLDEDADDGDEKLATGIVRAPTKFEKMYFPQTCQCIRAPCYCNGRPKTKPDHPREEMEE